MQQVKKVVIIGPESTGKSTLADLLSRHFETLWCPEFAREYLITHGMAYTYDDLLTIAEGQVALEDQYVAKAIEKWGVGLRKAPAALLFEDTDMYVIKVWCEYVFGKCHQYILDRIAENTCDLYLLCNIDLPWVKDELREYPDFETRKDLYGIYKELLINQKAPWIDIKGSYEDRLQKAIRSVDMMLT